MMVDVRVLAILSFLSVIGVGGIITFVFLFVNMP